jgi:hypothetical protein
MGDSLAPMPQRRDGPATLESRALFRMRCAELHEPASPMAPHPEIVLVSRADGSVVVYPPSEKLVILAAARKALRPAADT